MCIICCKPKNSKLPDEATIRRMFTYNRDGAGYMWAEDGKVRIRKGFMKLDALLDSLKELEKCIDTTATGMVLHFRIGTAGGNIPANTHPYPVTDNLKLLQALSVKTDLGVAHNGVIHITPRQKDINDTMEYIMSQLAPLRRACPKFYEDKNLVTLVKNAIQSKMAFLTSDGSIFTIGDFIEDNGLLYSNTSYQPYKWTYTWKGDNAYANWYWDDDDDYGTPSPAKRFTDEQEKIIVAPMQWLDEGDYVFNYAGEIFESDGYNLGIDENGVPHIYDYNKDCFIPFDGQAFASNGAFLKFSYEKASMENIEDFSPDKPADKSGKEPISQTDIEKTMNAARKITKKACKRKGQVENK